MLAMDQVTVVVVEQQQQQQEQEIEEEDLKKEDTTTIATECEDTSSELNMTTSLECDLDASKEAMVHPEETTEKEEMVDATFKLQPEPEPPIESTKEEEEEEGLKSEEATEEEDDNNDTINNNNNNNNKVDKNKNHVAKSHAPVVTQKQDKAISIAEIRNSFMSPGNQRPSLRQDLRSFFKREDSKSQLSLSVNDSAANKTFDECYDKEDFLGEGGFAVVHRCRHRERGNVYAVKEIENEGYEEAEGNSFQQEINNMKRLREIPYIVRLLDVFYAYDRTFLIMEEMLGGDLLDKIEQKEFYPEAECRKLARRLFEAIYYCHKKRIVHRDIKPENILLESKYDDTKIKLADFGCAKELKEDTVLTTMCGTPQYVAPEVYLQRSGYDEKCDLWSAAVVIYLLLAGYVPFDGAEFEMHKIVCAGEFEFHPKYWSEISNPPKQLIRDLLVVDPYKRASIVEILDKGWLKRLDREKAMKRRHSESSLLKSQCFNQSLRNLGESSADLNCIQE